MGNERKHEEYKAKKAAHQARIAARNKWECESTCTVSTAVTSEPAEEVDEVEVERLASMDKQVLKLTKKLREIGKLEGLRELDTLQVAKVARKHEVEVELDTALGLAKARVRNEVRGRGVA